MFRGARGRAFGIDTPGRCGLNWAAITVESLEMAFQVVAGLPGTDRTGPAFGRWGPGMPAFLWRLARTRRVDRVGLFPDEPR